MPASHACLRFGREEEVQAGPRWSGMCVPCRACSLHLVKNEEPWDGSGRDTYIRGRVKLRPLVLGLESRAGHRDEPCLNTATRVSETPHCWLSSTLALEVTIGMDGED